MGGYECADHINRKGERVNLLFETLHHEKIREDYALAYDLEIKTVREGICWSNVEKEPYHYDFSEVITRIKAAKEFKIQQIWDICHFGYPLDLIPTHPGFVPRFVSLCQAFTRLYLELTDETLFIVPINEISFLSWHSGDVRGTVPFAINSGFDIKYHLCKAFIAACEAIKIISPACRILTVEPLIKIHAAHSKDAEIVERMNLDQFQAMDIISGSMCPELGGRPEYLDIIGLNYYFNNQWLHNSSTWTWPLENDPREKLSNLLEVVNRRYNRPMLLSETGHFDEHRGCWIKEITYECVKAMQIGVNLLGICIYPLIERPDWDNLNIYHKSGIWDLDERKNRIIAPICQEALLWAQKYLKKETMQKPLSLMQI